MDKKEFDKLVEIESRGNEEVKKKKIKPVKEEIERNDPGEKKTLWNNNWVIIGIFAAVLIIGIGAFLITSKKSGTPSKEEKAAVQTEIAKENAGIVHCQNTISQI